MPLVLNKLPWPQVFGFIWFFLLFLAGITSSVSLAQPAVAFLEDEFNIKRKAAAAIFGMAVFILCQPAIFFLGCGVVDELDFWGGTFFLVVFATIETVLFVWVFGMDRAWEEIHRGADMRIPKVYKFIIKYITPLFLFFILSMWLVQEWLPIIMMKNVAAADKPFIFGTRLGLLLILIILVVLVKIAWRARSLRHRGFDR
jgi:SNF family Na+-dependent transporter